MAELVRRPAAARLLPAWAAAAGDRAADYLTLLKPGIMLLLVLTELAAMVMASRGWPGPRLLGAAVLGGVCASGGASAFNCWYDRDLDREMRRTARRPLPAGRIPAWHALVIAAALTILSVAVLGLAGNWTAAGLSVAGGVFYCLVYTAWLKRRTRYNIVIGGAAGCFPPLVGWALVTGAVSALPLLLALIVLFWTPPHFWSLALLMDGDYARAGVPMLPVVIGRRRSAARILAYSLLLVPLTLLPAVWLGPGYALAAGGLGAALAGLAVHCWRRPERRPALLLFAYSIAYLTLVFTAAAVAAVV